MVLDALNLAPCRNDRLNNLRGAGGMCVNALDQATGKPPQLMPSNLTMPIFAPNLTNR